MTNETRFGFGWNGSIAGEVDSIISLLAIEKSILQPLLPDHLVFAEQTLAPAGAHPVYLSFNFRQKNVETAVSWLRLNYAEFVFGIPCLRLANEADPASYAFAPFLYLNSFLGTIGGQIFYSLPKKLAHLELAQSFDTKKTAFFSASRFFDHNNFYFQSEFLKDSCPISSLKCANFLTVVPILTQPLIVYDRYRGFRTTSYTMEGIRNCAIQPVTGMFKTMNFVNGLSKQSMLLSSINNSVLGSFGISYNWQLSKASPVKTVL